MHGYWWWTLCKGVLRGERGVCTDHPGRCQTHHQREVTIAIRIPSHSKIIELLIIWFCSHYPRLRFTISEGLQGLGRDKRSLDDTDFFSLNIFGKNEQFFPHFFSIFSPELAWFHKTVTPRDRIDVEILEELFSQRNPKLFLWNKLQYVSICTSCMNMYVYIYIYIYMYTILLLTRIEG